MVALILSTVDVFTPFTFRTPAHGVVLAVFLFLFPVTRPAKLYLCAVGQGPLVAAKNIPQWLAIATLPVIPVQCLPSHVQSRVRTYKLSLARIAEIVSGLVCLVAAAYLRQLVHPDDLSVPWSRFMHTIAFVGFLVALMNGAAALATMCGVDVVEPFNRFWKATSVADWWRYRWDTVIALQLRMTLYDPIAGPVAHTGGKTATFLRHAAGVATFAGSSLIHEYALMAQGHREAPGQLTVYFMAQPLLIALEAALRQRHRRLSPPRHRGERQTSPKKVRRLTGPGGAIDRAITVVLIVASVYYWWCPAYDPPQSNANKELFDETLHLVGLCASMPHCSAAA